MCMDTYPHDARVGGPQRGDEVQRGAGQQGAAGPQPEPVLSHARGRSLRSTKGRENKSGVRIRIPGYLGRIRLL